MRCQKISYNFLQIHIGKTTSTSQEFTVYVNPYLVTTHKGDYTKHYYMGSERILSKPGDGTTYDNEDPRRTAKAGFSVDEAEMPDYNKMLTEAQNLEKTKADSLGLTYTQPKPNLGIYANNGREPEKQLYFLHSNHLGSASYITDASGEVYEHLEYTPSGEILLDDRAGTWQTRFTFTGKEIDEETGMVYLSNRYMIPKIGQFTTVDPPMLDGSYLDGYDIQKSENLSVYSYSYQNPVKYTDPTGECPPCLLIEALVDVGFTLFDAGVLAYKWIKDGEVDPVDIAALSADAYAILTPAFTGAGLGVRATAEVAEQAVKHADKVVDASKAKKTYQTYTKTNKKTGEVYTGRTSGNKTARENIAKRDKNHHKNKEGFGPAKLDKSSKNEDAIRGREQQMIDKNGGAKSEGGTSGNKIRGVSTNNPKAGQYNDAANKEF